MSNFGEGLAPPQAKTFVMDLDLRHR